MVTIADVAAAAGVSISTVSYVMSGKRTISQDTRERVESAIAKLEYSPHASARSLASRSTNVIGLQAPLRAGVDVHVIMEIVAGVVKEARDNHYDILLLTSDDADGLVNAARGSRVDALMVMDIESEDPRIATLRELSTPTVLIGLPSGAGDLICVDFDFEAAGRLAAERLAALGHTRVALFGAPAEVLERHTSYAVRLNRGFLAACEELGITGSVHACPSSADAVDAVDAVLDEDAAITGILFHNEAALPHVAAHVRNDATKRDVIALSPLQLVHGVAGLVDTIEVPATEIGAAAARAILGALEGETTERVRLLQPRFSGASAV
ncbi:DNA-binding LacI/PurR family transcriptional regulator [Microbacterium ginsengiterrae]|uniref:DNA-binding LacI/PurR family transcriptional regulator n=1 Tax=Microbacterium ginsengiterrae TaxID=546115 RepID=A0A7W9FDD8_9MICO|nr:LacI family DNA-binding transcriptional regulator [Microbacterium ginsengiterrae]MBB5743413.1 DNA-binding LacI/PurR family transcriptional regulator [Microbacterium ginsengiterrae]